jgi:hypothetical protein
MTRSLFPMLILLCAGGCTFMLGRTAADRAATTPGADEPATAAAAKRPSHGQQCSQLRADIASSQHNQRDAQPATQSPIIAAASTGKEDQRIEALQKRYSELGCTGGAAEPKGIGAPRVP